MKLFIFLFSLFFLSEVSSVAFSRQDRDVFNIVVKPEKIGQLPAYYRKRFEFLAGQAQKFLKDSDKTAGDFLKSIPLEFFEKNLLSLLEKWSQEIVETSQDLDENSKNIFSQKIKTIFTQKQPTLYDLYVASYFYAFDLKGEISNSSYRSEIGDLFNLPFREFIEKVRFFYPTERELTFLDFNSMMRLNIAHPYGHQLVFGGLIPPGKEIEVDGLVYVGSTSGKLPFYVPPYNVFSHDITGHGDGRALLTARGVLSMEQRGLHLDFKGKTLGALIDQYLFFYLEHEIYFLNISLLLKISDSYGSIHIENGLKTRLDIKNDLGQDVLKIADAVFTKRFQEKFPSITHSTLVEMIKKKIVERFRVYSYSMNHFLNFHLKTRYWKGEDPQKNLKIKKSEQTILEFLKESLPEQFDEELTARFEVEQKKLQALTNPEIEFDLFYYRVSPDSYSFLSDLFNPMTNIDFKVTADDRGEKRVGLRVLLPLAFKGGKEALPNWSIDWDRMYISKPDVLKMLTVLNQFYTLPLEQQLEMARTVNAIKADSKLSSEEKNFFLELLTYYHLNLTQEERPKSAKQIKRRLFEIFKENNKHVIFDDVEREIFLRKYFNASFKKFSNHADLYFGRSVKQAGAQRKSLKKSGQRIIKVR